MAGNLTREEARERADLLSVESYQVELDLAGHEETFRSVTTVTFGCTRPGSDTFIELAAPAVTQIILNGEPVPAGAFGGGRITLTGLEARNELRVTADCAFSRTGEGLHRFTDPADGGVYLYSDLETADAHRIFACFDQPDLKATFEFTVTAREGWQVVSNMAADRAAEPAGPGTVRWHFPPTPVMSDLHNRDRGGPVSRGSQRARRHPAGDLLPPVPGRLPRPGRDHGDHPAGLRLLPPGLRHPLSVRQVRPAVRARVQVRRDGERRLRDVPGGLHLPVQGHRHRARDPGGHDPA